ncbi:MBL fold metallo-hydrolase [Aliikangiella coralliicola]|uniref:MBL fold metallo-hydrolase n=1 Tax=Aliikangiella coralliicola TaxID=2592383 RepID=A0A545U4U2_9GAMM|nr:MBL fold metallo-hydrolase [Aliikangiella coralliicola]TQV84488.1 MBL fold metallo-hydrolase [Aliikangiella coralliicola]
MSLRVEVTKVTPFQQNCSVIWCSETLKAAVVDPGGDLDKILGIISKHQLNIEKILLTHGHLDHAGGAAALARQLSIPVEGPHQDDDFWLQGMEQQAQNYGFSGVEVCVPDRWLNEGESIHVGKEKLDVYHCPGHTPGHIIFHHQSSQLAFVGDVLFKGSIGRTDFPRGDFQTLVNSITTKLWPLGNKTRFVSGHGPISDFASERASNAFVSDAKLASA